MDFFDNLGKTLNDMAAVAADKVGELAETAKTKTVIANEKREVARLYETIGREILNERRDDLKEKGEDPIDDLCHEILEKEARIGVLQEELKRQNATETTVDSADEAVDAEVVEEEEKN